MRKVRFENYSLREQEDGQRCRILIDGIEVGCIIGFHGNFTVKSNRDEDVLNLTVSGGYVPIPDIKHNTLSTAKKMIRGLVEGT